MVAVGRTDRANNNTHHVSAVPFVIVLFRMSAFIESQLRKTLASSCWKSYKYCAYGIPL